MSQTKNERRVFNVSQAEVLRAHQTSNTTREAAEKVGLPIELFRARMRTIRKIAEQAGKAHKIKTMNKTTDTAQELLQILREEGFPTEVSEGDNE